MKKYCVILLLIFSSFLPLKAQAAWAPGDLTIIGLKMTGTESIVIENTSSAPLNLQNYLVEYFNKAAPASLATPTSSQQLPNLTLAPLQSILMNSDSSLICGATAVTGLGFSLSDTSGQVVIMKVDTQVDGSLLYRQQDHASWTSAASGADILKVPSNTVDPQAIWYRHLADGAWQQAELDGCSVLLAMVAPSSDPSFIQWASGQEPPATFVPAGDDNAGQSTVPTADLGLAAPVITELLPNPAAPQSDSEDEFIELYNSNGAAFDLTGFRLETGTSTKHFYTFPPGTFIQPRSFEAFYSVDTGLSLSNSGGQVWLLDPLGTLISQTETYSTAKDGQAWALANGSWQWTTVPTPNSTNIISQPLTTKSLSVGSSSKSTKAKAASTKSKASSKSKKTTSTVPRQSVSTVPAADTTAPIHPAVLAGIGAAALLYGLYEYRNDLANRIYKLRRDRATGAPSRKKP